MLDKEVYTTGEAARICGVSTMTIIRNFDSGKLAGYRVPGSKFRRIPHEALVRFMKEHGLAPRTADVREGAKVLIVEDDPESLRLLEKMLIQIGNFQVESATTGFEAGFQVARFRPRLVLLDIMLPGLDGFEVCRRIKADSTIGDTKVVAVTALNAPDEVEAMYAAGFDDHLPKPFTINDLQGKIMQFIPLKAGT